MLLNLSVSIQTTMSHLFAFYKENEIYPEKI